MEVDPEIGVTHITVVGFERPSECEPETRAETESPTKRTFAVVKTLHSSPILYGRGTRVWVVKDEQNNSFYVLKDSWIQQGPRSEIEFIKHIEKVVNEQADGNLFKYAHPHYYIGQEEVYDTGKIRSALPKKPPIRVQRRIVTGPIGDPITSFRSRYEFVSVMLDVVNFLEFLSEKGNVIHGDISINNILINRVWNSPSEPSPSQLRKLASGIKAYRSGSVPPRSPAVEASYDGTFEPIEATGFLIDCDFMRYKTDADHQTSGTLPYMAIGMLAPLPGFVHTPGHDLESLLHSMLTICHYTIAASGKHRQPVPGDERINLNLWFSTKDLDQLACTKSLTLEAFNTRIKPCLPPYWQDFAPFLARLIKATWGENYPYIEHPNIATHTAYRDILKEALEMYAQIDKNTPCVYALVPSTKRPREEPAHNPDRRTRTRWERTARRASIHYLESHVETQSMN
ncbi:hypothetical protein F5887DRAFT_887411 [Amanita rubescens]|nr:hypothetical protein F5887DRAFT_887411 [Amanita rubescens]